MENMEEDYQERPELDRYDDIGIDDDGNNQELSMNARMDVNR